jgi:hypothetical protein
MTVEQFNQIPHGEVFKVVVQKSTAFATRDIQGELVPIETMFVCKKGTGDDWAIYGLPVAKEEVQLSSIVNMVQNVASRGDKLTMEWYIKDIVNCDKDMFQCYRY